MKIQRRKYIRTGVGATLDTGGCTITFLVSLPRPQPKSRPLPCSPPRPWPRLDTLSVSSTFYVTLSFLCLRACSSSELLKRCSASRSGAIESLLALASSLSFLFRRVSCIGFHSSRLIISFSLRFSPFLPLSLLFSLSLSFKVTT